MKTLRKDIIRELYKSKSRFFSILLIVLLGTLAYVGLNMTVYDIENTFDNKLRKYNMYDIRIEAPAGFTEIDKNILNKISGVKSIEYYSEVVDYDNYNLYIKKKIIKNPKQAYYLINSKSSLSAKYEVIGSIFDVSYLQNNINKFGINIKNAYVISKDLDTLDNVALIHLDSTKSLNTFSKKYKEIVSEKKEEINALLINRPFERKEELNLSLNEAAQKIDDGINEIEKNKNNLIQQKELLAKQEHLLNQKKSEFYQAKSKFNSSIEIIEKEKINLNNKLNELNNNLKSVNNGLNEIEKNMPEIKKGLKKIEQEEQKITDSLIKLENNKAFISEEKYNEYLEQIKQGQLKIIDQKNRLIKTVNEKQNLINTKNIIENGINDIQNALKQIDQNYSKLNSEKQNFEKNYNSNEKELIDSNAKIQKAKKDIEKGNTELNYAKVDLLNKKDTIQNEAKALEAPIYDVGSRFDNNSFLTLYNNIESMKIMCILFPICFFVIMFFIVTTTMIRFANEQRQLVGTYRFLGYSFKYIIIKFLVYGLVPTIIGLLFGSLIGTYILPKMIYPAFVVDFVDIFEKPDIYFKLEYIIKISLILILLIIISILYVINLHIKDSIVNLLTGYKEEIAKRILLEKTFFWNKLSFSKKIMFRNIFKYKGRLFMTLIGISSCTALVYLGFSLNYSIKEITKYQYTKIRKFDATVYFKSNISDENIEKYIQRISKDAEILKINSSNSTVRKDGLYYIVEKIKVSNKNIKDFYNFNFDNSNVILSSKTSKILDVYKNDKIKVYDMYNRESIYTVDKIYENYIGQYLFLKSNDFKVNALNIKFKKSNNNINLHDKDLVYNVIYEKDNQNLFDKQIKSLSLVISLMIILGGALAIIVTYNLGNINILERKKEISTLEVLGYRDKELRLYIFREIILMAIFSILIGLVLGRALQLFIANQFKQSPIELVTNLNYKPFVISFIISFMFIIIVLILLSIRIKKINMVEALKAGE